MTVRADLLLANCVLRDAVVERVSCLAVADGVIVARGTLDELRTWKHRGTEVIDCRGGCLVPGLVDCHQHPLWGRETAVGVDLSGLRTLDAVRAALMVGRAEVAPGQWLRGHSLSYEAFADGGMRADLLEDVTGDSPTLLLCFDGHTALASKSALRAAGVDGPVEFAEAAEVVCVNGEPTGELRETPAIELIRSAAPAEPFSRLLGRYAQGLQDMSSVGLTGIHVMDGDRRAFRALSELEASGLLPMRIQTSVWIKPEHNEEEIEDLLALASQHGVRWRAGLAKFLIDGVIESGTAWLYEPDTRGRGTASFWPDLSAYRSLVRRFTAAGCACATHAVGDKAVGATLDAYADGGVPQRGHHRVEHIELLADVDLERFARLGVCASMQPLHLENSHPDLQDPWSQAVGSDVKRAFRTKDLLEAGVVLGLGSDWPVASFDPRVGMAWARLRRPPGMVNRSPYGSGQRLTGAKALDGYTRSAALIAGDLSGGSLSVGGNADLTLFAEDPVAVSADDLPGLPVLLTVVEGEITHRAPGLC